MRSPLALGDDDRLADAPPAVTDADADRRLGADRRAQHGAGEHLVAVELVRLAHREVVARAAADERDARTGDAVGAAHDLRAPAGQPLGDEQQQAVRRGELRDPRRGADAGRARPVLQRGQRRADGQARAAERDHDDATRADVESGDLPRGRAADQRHVAAGGGAHGGGDLGQFARRRAEHDQQRGGAARECRGGRLAGRLERVGAR